MVNEGEKSRSNQAVVRHQRGAAAILPVDRRSDGIRVPRKSPSGAMRRFCAAVILL
jgi:hypothetical protein